MTNTEEIIEDHCNYLVYKTSLKDFYDKLFVKEKIYDEINCCSKQTLSPLVLKNSKTKRFMCENCGKIAVVNENAIDKVKIFVNELFVRPDKQKFFKNIQVETQDCDYNAEIMFMLLKKIISKNKSVFFIGNQPYRLFDDTSDTIFNQHRPCDCDDFEEILEEYCKNFRKSIYFVIDKNLKYYNYELDKPPVDFEFIKYVNDNNSSFPNTKWTKYFKFLYERLEPLTLVFDDKQGFEILYTTYGEDEDCYYAYNSCYCRY